MAKSMPIDLKSKLSTPSPAFAFNSMLGVDNQKDIRELEISSLFPYPNQPFKPYTDEKLQELAEDIRANGVLSPVIVRPLEDGYQILAGHNRVNACKLAGLLTVPCIVKNFDDDMAQLVLVNTNLNQRQELLPSEKAFAYKMQMDAIKRQGKRTDLTSHQFGGKSSESANRIAELSNTSANQVRRFIRLTFLNQPLLDMVNITSIPVNAGVELSYLNSDTQKRLLEYMDAYNVKIDLKKAELLRKSSNEGELTRNEISSLLSKPPKAAKEKTAIKIQTVSLQRFFPDMNQRQIEKEILKILEQHFENRAGTEE